MQKLHEAEARLANVPDVAIHRDVPLKDYTRFALGGPAAILADARTESAFQEAVRALQQSDVPWLVIGGGTNLVCSDAGYAGVVLRYIGAEIGRGGTAVTAQAGASLQAVVDFTIAEGLSGIHTMTGVPGWVGGAVYGNAGAYGRSMHQNVVGVRFFDGTSIQVLDNAECGFRYRHSVFKTNKRWIVLATTLQLTHGNQVELAEKAAEIFAVRNAKYPPDMKCAGSIFKNLILAELPAGTQVQVDPQVVREGKVPSAWFLEQVGAKGIRVGGIHVADYHANLIYNTGNGTAEQVREIVNDLKQRVRLRFDFEVEEEVQYVGF